MPYKFSEAVAANDTQTDLIRSAMQEWEQKTCVTFQPYSPEAAEKLGHDQRIIFQDDLEGCKAVLGFQPKESYKYNPDKSKEHTVS